LVQEFLNRTEDHLWAFVSNGRQLRILRDNVALSRQAYIEFDLEGMFDGEVYSDFALLWMVCHVTRTGDERPELCWLEKWSTAAREHGTRVLENLRVGVERSIEALGRGFVSHPANDKLRQKLRDGLLDKQDLYHQVLRTVYRLLFLFVAEDRDLLHPPAAPDSARHIYDQHYSARRLRDLAGNIKGSRHGDLWHVLSLTFTAVSGEESAENIRTHLGLPALGSHLWRLDETPDILGPCLDFTDPVKLSNDDLLDAIRHLAYVQQERTLQSVNYRDLGSEELGSVYESLLELQPDIHPEARKFELRTVTGSERKTTGSYYTPDSLVQCLLDSALEPIIKDRLNAAGTPDAKQQALLDLKVCDPACGSGHFLIAAAHRIARHLARVRALAAGEAEPTPDVYQHALRDVIAHCVYGVDINPMAVELCKVSLWLEALDPGRPLAFLDHHIQCGNSLLGTTSALIAEGIPDTAYKPIEGDDRESCKQLKAVNKSERQGQRRLWGATPSINTSNMAEKIANIDAEDDSTPEALAAKEKHYQEFVSSSAYEHARFLADAWCAAFVWPKTDPRDLAITTETIRRIEDSPNEYLEGSHIRKGVRKLANQYQFFHWHLVFPDVFRVPADGERPENELTGWSGGFDCILGNPPWETLEFKEKEWFASLRPEIEEARTAAIRRSLIASLAIEAPEVFRTYSAALRLSEGERALVRNSGRFPLCARGKINTFSIFAEAKTSIVGPLGRVGCIVPSGIASDDTTKYFFGDLVASGRLHSLYSFENEEFIFPHVHHATKFCLLTIGGRKDKQAVADYAFFARQVTDLRDESRHFTLSPEDIARLSPNTKTCPVFRDRRDAELTKYLYCKLPVLIRDNEVDGNPWGLAFKQGLFNTASDSALFLTHAHLQDRECTKVGPGYEYRNATALFLPFYEAKMLHQFDSRFGTYHGQTQAQANQGKLPELSPEQHADPFRYVRPRYWVEEPEVLSRTPDDWPHRWLLGWRDITSAVTTRTMISTVFPRYSVGDTFLLMFPKESLRKEISLLLGCINSFAFDYCVRQKIGGTHLKYHTLKQVPIAPPRWATHVSWQSTSLGSWLRSVVLELTYTAWDLTMFALDLSYDGPPFVWDEERRFLIRCELDATFFHLYLGTKIEWRESGNAKLLEYFPTPRHAVEYIMETFPIVKRKDEQAHGQYRTKNTILEIYDEMAEAIAANEAARAAARPATAQYQTRLDPPPGPPTDAAGNFIPYADWTDEICERYKNTIHPPKETAA
jgi:hypothetical protein